MNVVWGPYHHQSLDLWMSQAWGNHPQLTFGPNGADMVYRPERGDPLHLAVKPDVMICLEPHARLCGEELLQLPFPVVAMSTAYPLPLEAWTCFDALFPIDWIPSLSLAQEMPVAQPISSWLPKQQLLDMPKSAPVFELLCLGRQMTPAIWQAAEAYDPCFLYHEATNGLHGDLYKLCAQSRVVLLTENKPDLAFDLYFTGAHLVVLPPLAAVLGAYLQEGRDFMCLERPADLAHCCVQTPARYALSAQHSLRAEIQRLWPDIEARCQSRLTRASTGLQQMWRLGSVQREALPLLPDSEALRCAYDYGFSWPETPLTAANQLCKGWYHLQRGECAEARACVSPLLGTEPSSEGLFPIAPESAELEKTGQLWPLSVWALWLASEPEDLSFFWRECPAELRRLLMPRVLAFLQAHPQAGAAVQGLCSPEETCQPALQLALLKSKPLMTSDQVASWGRFYRHCLAYRSQSVDLMALLPPARQNQAVVLWEGDFLADNSFAEVNHALLHELQSHEQVTYFRMNTIWPRLSMRELDDAFPEYQPHILVSHTIPYRHQRPNWPCKWVSIIPWEFDRIPRNIADAIAAGVDEVWTPSDFCVDAFVREGVAPERVRKIPNGVHTHIFKPEGDTFDLPTTKKCRFLFVGGCIPRKGIDILLDAYLQAFGPEDDVCLVIKTFGLKTHYQEASRKIYARLKNAMANPAYPEIILLDNDRLSDEDLASLYRACQVYVHPYRGEGFGLPILEALACGLPVVIPDKGPAREFCPPEARWLIPTSAHFMMRQEGPSQGTFDGFTTLPNVWYEPHCALLAQTMQRIYLESSWQDKSSAARAAALPYDWKHIATHVQQAIQTLLDAPLEPIAAVPAHTPVAASLWCQTQSVLDQFPLPEPWIKSQSLDAADWVITSRPLEQRHHKQVVYLNHAQAWRQLNGVALQQVWTPEPEWAEPLLQRGFPATRIAHLAEPFAFADFTPGILPQYLQGQKWRILFVGMWQAQGWHSLLKALPKFAFPAPYEVTLVPLGSSLPEVEAELQRWQQKQGAFPVPVSLRSLPQTGQLVKALYQSHSFFVDLSPHAQGRWHLLAQSMGILCFGGGQRAFLREPFAEVVESEDVDSLIWRLNNRIRSPQLVYDGLAIREHLQALYDVSVVQEHWKQCLLNLKG